LTKETEEYLEEEDDEEENEDLRGNIDDLRTIKSDVIISVK
jgi:hypothetical protein